MKKIVIIVCFILIGQECLAQTETDTSKKFLKVEQTDKESDFDDLDAILSEDTKPQKVYARYAFKSSRVVMGHSIEMIGRGVLDFRILHRFGMFKDGISQLFGLDQASMRMGFDYGVSKNLTLGFGRSTFNKELDGFFKWRIAHQHTKVNPIPFSILLVSGITLRTIPQDPQIIPHFSNRLGFYHQLIIGRKFNDGFTLQVSPTLVHRNTVPLVSDKNDLVSIGVGSRIRMTKRTSLIVDAFPLVYGYRQNFNYFPMSIGLDIETGGHVFQLHISNAKGMNEKAFITETTQRWDKGEIQFGFNLSRVFTIVKNKETNF